MADVRVVIAIGRRGQFGLHGHLPWEGQQGRPFVEDVERFFDLTRGHVVLVGPATYASFPDFVRGDRTIVELRSSMQPAEVLARFPDRTIFVGGGPAVFGAYARYVRHWDINRLPYDGEADRWFDPKWLVAAT